MATISTVDLKVGKGSGTDAKDFVIVSFDVNFTTYEKAYSSGFYLKISLYEVDKRKDSLYQDSYGNINQITVTSPSDIRDRSYGTIHNETIHPSSTIQHFDIMVERELGSFETDLEEFLAVVSIFPKFSYGVSPRWRKSNTVKIDIDD